MDTKLLASQLCTGTACWRSPDMLNMSQKDLAGEGAAETFIFASDNLAWMYGISNDLHQSYGIQPPCFVRCTKNTP
jgi:hypothetical protein